MQNSFEQRIADFIAKRNNDSYTKRKVSLSFLLLMIIGVLCGIAAFLIVSALDHSVTTDAVGGRGFTAIMVSWLAKFNPIVMIFTSFLLVFLDRGASEIATAFRLNESVSEILSGIILFFIIGSEFFINYKISIGKLRKGGK